MTWRLHQQLARRAAPADAYRHAHHPPGRVPLVGGRLRPARPRHECHRRGHGPGRDLQPDCCAGQPVREPDRGPDRSGGGSGLFALRHLALPPGARPGQRELLRDGDRHSHGRRLVDHARQPARPGRPGPEQVRGNRSRELNGRSGRLLQRPGSHDLAGRPAPDQRRSVQVDRHRLHLGRPHRGARQPHVPAGDALDHRSLGSALRHPDPGPRSRRGTWHLGHDRSRGHQPACDRGGGRRRGADCGGPAGLQAPARLHDQ